MAFTHGTATSPADFYAKLRTFLRTDTELMAAGENWSTAWTHPDGDAAGVILRGPGLGGTESILVGFELYQAPTTDQYWMTLRGMSRIIPTSLSMLGHDTVMPDPVRIYLTSIAMEYWIVASGRRFIVVTRIGSVWGAAYGGLFLPYSDPLKYALPLMVGGSTGRPFGGSDKYSEAGENHAIFPYSHYRDIGSYSMSPSLWMMSPEGTWLRVVGALRGDIDGPAVDVVVHPNRASRPQPYFSGVANDLTEDGTPGQVNGHARMISLPGDVMTLTHMQLVRINNTQQILGTFDGIMRVIGVNNPAGNLVSVDGIDYLVIQNTRYTTGSDFCAVRLN